MPQQRQTAIIRYHPRVGFGWWGGVKKAITQAGVVAMTALRSARKRPVRESSPILALAATAFAAAFLVGCADTATTTAEYATVEFAAPPVTRTDDVVE